MKTTRRLSRAYDARIERLSAVLKLRAEWERRGGGAEGAEGGASASVTHEGGSSRMFFSCSAVSSSTCRTAQPVPPASYLPGRPRHLTLHDAALYRARMG